MITGDFHIHGQGGHSLAVAVLSLTAHQEQNPVALVTCSMNRRLVSPADVALMKALCGKGVLRYIEWYLATTHFITAASIKGRIT